jgi:type IV pilus assembly protein PilP
MKNYLALIRTFSCLMGMALLLLSCDESNPIAAQPPVVRKKLPGQVGGAPPAAPVVMPATAPPPAPAAEPKPVVAHVKVQDTIIPPSPKPMESAPPVPSGSVAAAAQTGEPPKPGAAPPQAAPAPDPAAPNSEAALAVTESQVAALLNLQVPPPYNPKNKADPFEPLLRDESVQPAVAKLTGKKRDSQSPLEKIDLGQLKLVAIIAAPSGNRALVEESSGKGYILREGTYVGQNSGKVVDIALDKVMVEEEFVDAYGKTITQKKEITLPKPPGEL